MPALVKRRFGESGNRLEEGMMVCFFDLKKSRKDCRMSALDFIIVGRQEVEMDFRAGAARAGVAHHPEIVLFVAVDDVNGRVDAFLAEDFSPDVGGLLVEVRRITLGFVG